MRAGDSYLKRPCLGWCVVYGLHSITHIERSIGHSHSGQQIF